MQTKHCIVVIFVIALQNPVQGEKTVFTAFKVPNNQGAKYDTSLVPSASITDCLLWCAREELCKSAMVDEGNECKLIRYGEKSEEKSFRKDEPIDSCAEVTVSDDYTLRLQGNQVKVYCQVDHTGAWIVIQRRQDGSVDFFRDWAAYKSGFGDVNGEFWWGNEYLHLLTSNQNMKMRVLMESKEGENATVQYKSMSVAEESDNYRITLGQYSGTNPPGDAMNYGTYAISGIEFSTFDVDNDLKNPDNCAKYYQGGWWFTKCFNANPNGIYNATGDYFGILWWSWKGMVPLKAISLMLGN